MSARGVHFALTPTQARNVLTAKTDQELVRLVEQIESAWDTAYLVESDKAWDPIHRCLTDGSLLFVSGEYPLNHCICGGEQLHQGDGYTVSYVTAHQVKDVAGALAKMTKVGMRKRYDEIDPEEYEPNEQSDEDFEYTWQNFLDVRRFYKTAAQAGRAVIFTSDC
jgi:hypothetical protein